MADTGTILVSIVVATGSTLVADVSKGNVTIKPVIAGFLLTGGLLLVATFSSEIADMFAIIIMVTALVRNGSVLGSVLTSVSKNANSLTSKG